MADIAQATEYLQSLLNSPLMEADPVYQELKGEDALHRCSKTLQSGEHCW